MLIPNYIMGVLLALGAAFTWGTGDFGGGLATRKNNQYLVLMWSSISGLVVLFVCVFIFKENMPSLGQIGYGLLAGFMGALGMSALFRGLSLGHAASVAPFSAVITAILPVIFSTFTQGFPGLLKWGGFLLALIGIWFVAHIKAETPEDNPREGIILAVLAGVGFGCFFILVGQFSPSNVFIPLIVTRLMALLTASALMLINRIRLESPRKNLAMLWIGLLDVSGNICYVLARQYIRLDVTAVLSSLYPAATILWARLILKEKINPYQKTGIILCLAAIVLITL